MSETALLPLVRPISSLEPCGPDLEIELDPGYMNCVARLQGDMPRSYLNYLYPSTEDDRVTIDFPRVFDELSTFVTLTHDIRLLVLRARFEIVALDLTRFRETLATLAALLSTYWEDVHPRAESGEWERRRVEIAALDDAIVLFALQYAPLCEHRRLGRVSWRAYMYAQNKAKPRTGETAPSESALIDALKQSDPDEIEPSRNNIAALIAALETINATWREKVPDEAPPIDKLLDLARSIQGLLDLGRPDQPPSLMERASSALGGLLGVKSAAPVLTGAAIATSGQAGEAMAALSRYFARAEPSSPALPLVEQAAMLRGKSFYEALQVLLPKQADQAAFRIGAQSIFDLSLSRAAAARSEERADEPADGVAGPGRVVESRQQALSVMAEIIAFYKATEPSSPIPWLLDRAIGLAERDFMSLLGDVLPKAALRDVGG